MSYDAVKQGLRDLLNDDAEILFEPWDVFCEALKKHTDDVDDDAVYLIKNLWDAEENCVFYDALDMDADEQSEMLRKLTQELEVFILSEEEGKTLLDILTYAATGSARKFTDANETKQTEIMADVFETDEDKEESADSLLPNLDKLLSDTIFCDSDETEIGCSYTEESIAPSEFFLDVGTIGELCSASENITNPADEFCDALPDTILDGVGPEQIDESSSPQDAYTLEQEIESLAAYHNLLLRRDDEGLPNLSLPLHIVLTGGRESDRREAAESLARHACDLGFLEEYALYEGGEAPSGASCLWYIRLDEIEACDLNKIAREMGKTNFIIVLSGAQKELEHAFKICPPLSLGYVHQVHLAVIADAALGSGFSH